MNEHDEKPLLLSKRIRYALREKGPTLTGDQASRVLDLADAAESLEQMKGSGLMAFMGALKVAAIVDETTVIFGERV